MASDETSPAAIRLAASVAVSLLRLDMSGIYHDDIRNWTVRPGYQPLITI